MKKRIYKYLMLTLFAVLTVSVSQAQEKLAQTGFNFLSISSDARSSAMGDAVNSLSGYSGALFHNPSSMAEIPQFFTGTFSINQWIADINYLSASMTLAPADGKYGVFGVSLQSVDYGEIQGTMVANNEQGYTDTKLFSPTAMAIGFGYAKALNEQFSVGAQVRYAYQKLGESTIPDGDGTTIKQNKANAIAYDFGTVYKTGVESLAFGMSVRNFSTEIKFEEEDFQLPMIFTIGISANLFDFFDVGGPEQALLLSIDATHPRAHPEQIKIGVEYNFMNVIYLRGGYVGGNDEDDFSFGVGLAYMGVELDYAYTPFGVFDSVQRFTARMSF